MQPLEPLQIAKPNGLSEVAGSHVRSEAPPNSSLQYKARLHPSFGNVRIRSRGRLPHWEVEFGSYFVSFRLGESLPKETVECVKECARMLLAAHRFNRRLLPCEENMVAQYSLQK